jgi:hypothetical protein
MVSRPPPAAARHRGETRPADGGKLRDAGIPPSKPFGDRNAKPADPPANAGGVSTTAPSERERRDRPSANALITGDNNGLFPGPAFGRNDTGVSVPDFCR